MKNKKKLIISLSIKLVLLIIMIFLLIPNINPLLPKDLKEELINVYKNNIGILVDGSSGGISLAKVLCGVAGFILFYLVITLVSLGIDKLCSFRKRSQTVAGLIISIFKTIGYITYIVWFLSMLGVNLVAIFASLGVVSLIIGFGVQSLIEDCITGIFIIIEGEYNIGDIIVLDDFRGVVKKISLRTTTIEDDGGNLKIINNSDIRNIQNRSNNVSLAICEVGISYEENLLKVEEIIKKELPLMYERNKDMFTTVPRYGGVQDLASSSVVLRIYADCKESDVFVARRRLNREMKLLFDKNNINIPFNQLVITRKEDELK